MKRAPLFAVVALCAAVTAVNAQVSFDFEGVTLTDLETAGWSFFDEQPVGADPVVTYPGTIAIETNITHSGSGALLLSGRDLAYFPLNGEFGTLDLWAFDFGYRVEGLYDNAYGPTFGLRKFDTAGYGYGLIGGLVQKSFLGSDAGYGVDWGNTENLDVAEMNNDVYDGPNENPGIAGDQSWWSPQWAGYLPSGRPNTWNGSTGGGWNHWRIAYLAPGQMEIEIVESWAGDNRVCTKGDTVVTLEAFNGTMATGVDDICLYGGRSMIAGYEPEPIFGVGLFDDVTWTPVETTPTFIPGDANGDGTVNIDDFVALKNGFGVGSTWAEGDFNGDGAVNIDDFVILKNNFGATAVPEPATMSLLALGGLAAIRRRK